MKTLENYEKIAKQNKKRNKKFLEEFEKELNNKGLSEKTIKNHINNIDLYINDYLNYYEFTNMEEGCHMIDGFLGDWFIRKCMWSTAYSIKTTAASIKKFYQHMSELNYISKEDYKFLCDEIKDNMEFWIEEVNEYNDDSFIYDIDLL